MALTDQINSLARRDSKEAMSLGFYPWCSVTPCLSLFILYLPTHHFLGDPVPKSSSNPVWMKAVHWSHLLTSLPPFVVFNSSLVLATVPLLTLYGPGVLIPGLQSLFSCSAFQNMFIYFWSCWALAVMCSGFLACKQGLLFSCGAWASWLWWLLLLWTWLQGRSWGLVLCL